MHLVLHLHWRPPAGADQEPYFWAWAETSEASAPIRRRGALPNHPRPHPFAVRDLRSVMDVIAPGANNMGQRVLVLHLPTTRTGPLPSNDLAHNWDIDRDAPFLAPWEIPAVRLPMTLATNLLGALDDRQWPEHFTCGVDLRYWHKAFGFVLSILAQQQFIPTLTVSGESNTKYHAMWRPVLEGARLETDLATIAAAMPPICRAELRQPGVEPSPAELLHDFVCYLADHLIRTWGLAAPHRLGYLARRDVMSTWLQSLVLPDTLLDSPDGSLERFAAELRAWQRNLAPISNAGFAVALRLVPPPISVQPRPASPWYVPEGGWKLEYLLQARDSTDVLAPAELVWQAPIESLVYQQRRFDRPQELLLAGLGRAASIFPPITRSLQAPAPTHVDLSTTEVYTFLREAAPLLHQSGFSLLLPHWWEAAGATLGLAHYLTPLGPQPPNVVNDLTSADRPISYRWELILGGAALTRQAFADLVALRSPLVQRDGQWLRLDPEQIEAATRFWERQSFEGRINLQQALRAALGLDDKIKIAGLPVLQRSIDGWLPGLIRQLTEGDESLRLAPQPDGLNGVLRPYQRFGVAWLRMHRQLGLSACLADDMGLGKSVQAIGLLLQEQKERGVLPGPTLLIAPTSLLGNWRREIRRFAPNLRVFVHYGSDRPRNETFAAIVMHYDLVLTSYTLARRDAELFENYRWHGLILDEAQKIKNPDIQVTQAIERFPAAFRLALTGTPIENQLTELWSIFNFLNKGYLGSLSSFRKHFAYPIERYQDPAATARLQRMIRPFVLRRLKTDPNVIQDLPERLDMKVYCTLTDEQAELYQAVVAEGLPRVRDLHGRARRLHIFNLLTRLKQILNHPTQYLAPDPITARFQPTESLERRSGKLDRLTEMLDEVLSVGDRALVYTQFAETGHLLAWHLQQQFDRPVFYLHGGVPLKQRLQMVTNFQEDSHAPHIFILTLKAGGLGLNLTAANHVFHYDRWWNPAVEDQASDRIYRIGQTRNVQTHKFITAGTLEEGIDEMIERKQGLADRIISGREEDWLTELSFDELAELVSLTKERI